MGKRNGDAEVQWYTVKADGTKVLINDTANGGIPAYRATTTPIPPYVKYVSPPPVQRQMNQPSTSVLVVLADGSTAVDDSSVQFKLDGITPAFSKSRQGSQINLTYAPTGIQFPEDQHQAQLAFKSAGGTSTNIEGWTFLNLKNIVLPTPLSSRTLIPTPKAACRLGGCKPITPIARAAIVPLRV